MIKLNAPNFNLHFGMNSCQHYQFLFSAYDEIFTGHNVVVMLVWSVGLITKCNMWSSHEGLVVLLVHLGYFFAS